MGSVVNSTSQILSLPDSEVIRISQIGSNQEDLTSHTGKMNGNFVKLWIICH